MVEQQISGHGRLYITCIFIISLISTPFCTPSLASFSTLNGNVLDFTIQGSDIGTIQSLHITCSYNPALADIMESLISSPTPETVFSAVVDTATNKLTIIVLGTGTVTIPDNAEIVLMHIPLLNQAQYRNAVVLKEATLVDEHGTTVAVEIDTTRIARPERRYVQRIVADYSLRKMYSIFTVSGQRMSNASGAGHLAPGLLVHSAGKYPSCIKQVRFREIR